MNLRSIFPIVAILFVTATAAESAILRVWKDCSTSVAQTDFDRTASAIMDILRKSGDRLEGVEIVCFSLGEARIFTAPVEKFIWGPTPVIKKVEPKWNKASIGQKIIRGGKEMLIRDAEAKQNAEMSVELKKHADRIEFNLRAFRATLLERPAAVAPCTRFSDLAIRIAEENLAKNLLLTDGWRDCPADNHPPVIKKMTGQILIILLPRVKDAGVEITLFQERSRYLVEFFPNAKIVQPFLTEKALDELLLQHDGGSVNPPL
jgi:hypothetical protein